MKEIFIQIFGSIAAYFVLLLLCTNLLGFVVRGLLETSPSIPDESTSRLAEYLKTEIKKNRQANIIMTLGSIILTVSFYYALFHFWNIGLAVTAGLIMACRLPDLLWEIRHGQKITRTNMPKTIISYISTAILWLCLPLTWYCLFRLN